MFDNPRFVDMLKLIYVLISGSHHPTAPSFDSKDKSSKLTLKTPMTLCAPDGLIGSEGHNAQAGSYTTEEMEIHLDTGTDASSFQFEKHDDDWCLSLPSDGYSFRFPLGANPVPLQSIAETVTFLAGSLPESERS